MLTRCCQHPPVVTTSFTGGAAFDGEIGVADQILKQQVVCGLNKRKLFGPDFRWPDRFSLQARGGIANRLDQESALDFLPAFRFGVAKRNLQPTNAI